MRKISSILALIIILPVLMAAYPQPSPSDGYIPGGLISTGNSQDATVIKSSAGVLGYIFASNVNSSPMYVKIYDKATAPTSSDTPKIRMLVPGSTTGSGNNMPIPLYGARFSNGISFRIVTTSPDSGNTGVAAGEVILNYGYK